MSTSQSRSLWRGALPAWGEANSRMLGGRRFTLAWLGVYAVGWFADVLTNRSLLNPAHEEFSKG